MAMDRRLLSYGVAIASTAIALFLSLYLKATTIRTIEAFFHIAIVVGAWYGGSSGIATILLSTLALNYFFIPPIHQFYISSSNDVFQLLLIATVGLIINLLSVSLRRNKQAEITHTHLLQQEQTARARVENLLHQMEAKYSQLEQVLHQIPVGVAIAEAPSGKLLFHNEEAIQLLRHPLLTSDTYRGYSQYGAVHADGQPYKPEEYPIARSLLQGEVIKAEEMSYRRGDGVITQFSVSAAPIRDQSGQIISTVATFEDISDRKHTEDRRRQAEQTLAKELLRIQTLFKASFDGIVILDEQGNVLDANPRFSEMLGYTLDEVKQLSLFDWDAQFTHEELEQLMEDYICSKSGVLETQHRRKDGSIYDVEISSNIVTWSGEILRFCVCRDISERKRLEKQSQHFMRQIVDASPNILYLYDLQQQRNVYCNREVATVLGYSPQEVQDLGSNLFQKLMHPDDLAHVPAQQERLNRSIDNEIIEFEYRMKHADGEWRWLYGRDTVFSRDVEGHVQQVIGTAQDITNLKQAEQTIRQQVDRETLLREITQRIRQSLDLPTIFDTACKEILHWSQAERVGIFKFDSIAHLDSGEFVAESVVPGLPSVLATPVCDHCFGNDYAPLYQQGRIQAISDIEAAGLQPCHRDVLAKFHIRANLIVPLLQGNDLWGLLCIHQCSAPRQWQPFEIQVVQEIANQLAIAIQQAILYEQVQSELQVRQKAEAKIVEQLRQQQTLGIIIQHVRESLNLNEILATVTHQIKDILRGDRVIVFRLFPDGKSQIVEEAVSSDLPALKARHWENEVWSTPILECYWQGKPRIVTDVMDDTWTDCLVDYSREGLIQSKMVAPILQEAQHSEEHRWVNPQQQKQLWGILSIHACHEKRVWQETEAELLQQIANQLAIAIQQANLFEQLQQQLTKRQQAQQLLAERNQQLAISNQELARATRLKDEFLANMSHELRTPLNAILGMAEGLQEQTLGQVNDRQLKALQTIERTGSHLLELINDILDLAKIESGQIELHCAPTTVPLLCRTSLDFIKQQAFKKQIQLELMVVSPLPHLYVDELRIRQVLVNVLNNAVKFTPQGGHVTLEARLFVCSPEERGEKNWVRFTVTDTGIGIAPDYIPKLFHPFVQIDSALNRQHDGTGLGLALVKRIVELHGGYVAVTSEVGVGSCFTIDLPYTIDALVPAKSESQLDVKPEMNQSTPGANPLILLVEDNEDNILTISTYLEVKGHSLLVARSGQEAIALAQAQHPDLILMDIQMPGMDGLEAIRHIRCLPGGNDIPIIALTALAMRGDRERCLSAGANDYLSKPVKLKQLTATIQQLLKSNQG